MNEQIIKQLKELKAITPREAFLKNSKTLILASGRSQTPAFSLRYFFKRPVFGALTFAVIVLLVIVTGFWNVLPIAKPAVSSILNPADLSKEFNDLTINIQLKEIKYDQAVNQAIASAVVEIGDNKTKHLNRSLLESEAPSLNLNDSESDKINEMLNQVIF